jgi:hypothetical protein
LVSSHRNSTRVGDDGPLSDTLGNVHSCDPSLTFNSDAAMHEAVPAIAACGVSPIVRIPDNQGFMVKSKVVVVPPILDT